jgi:hypothetical protein
METNVSNRSKLQSGNNIQGDLCVYVASISLISILNFNPHFKISHSKRLVHVTCNDFFDTLHCLLYSIGVKLIIQHWLKPIVTDIEDWLYLNVFFQMDLHLSGLLKLCQNPCWRSSSTKDQMCSQPIRHGNQRCSDKRRYFHTSNPSYSHLHYNK